MNKTLCLNFCAYYKPDKDEALACRGYEVVERLIQEGRPILFQKSGAPRDQATTELIVQNLCSACGFQEDGCDFMLDRKAPPCGGFLFLAQLLGEGTITIDDIK